MPIPAIAIHQSGPSDKIAKALDTSFKTSGHQVTTLAFDFGRVHPRPRSGGLRNLYRFSRRTAANISTAAHIGLEFGAHPFDAQLGAWQITLHRLLQVAVAGLVAIATVAWLTNQLMMPAAAWYGLPTAAFSPMRWLGTAQGYLELGLGGGITLLILMGGVRLALTMSPRPVIITFRSIVLLLVQPVLILGIAALTVNAVAFATFVVVIAALSLISSGFDAVVTTLVGAGVLLAARTYWARGPLQQLADGLLEGFRYLGEPDYRHRVQEALDRAITRARERTGHDGDFILAGQGLGSMIALDSVLHSRVWRPNHRVLLVTAGSPLRRFFLSLYPRTLFPESMEDVVDLIAGRLEAFRWLNIYHPGDPTGADLGLRVFNGLDVTTGRRGLVIPGRTNYWQSLDARRALNEGLERLRDVEPLRVPMKDAAHRLLDPAETVPTFSIPGRARPVIRAAVVLGTFGWMAWWVATGSGLLASTSDSSPALLLESGIVVDASVTHRRRTVPRELGVTYVDHWQFAFTDPTGTPQTIRAQHDLSDSFLAIRPPRFDDRAVAEQVRASCVTNWPPRWWMLENASAPCTIDPVRVRYYPGDMTLFDLPDHPRHRFGHDPIRGWTEASVVAAVLTPMFLIPMVIGARLFAALSGFRAAETPGPVTPAKGPGRVPAPRHAVSGRT